MATDKEEKRQNLINRILGSISQTQFGGGFGEAFNLDSEDRRDALFARREAEGKAPIPPRYQLTLSQHPLVDTVRQIASTTKNQSAADLLGRLTFGGFGPYDDGMYSFRAKNGLNVGGAPSNIDLPDLEYDEDLGGVRKPTKDEAKLIEADKKRVREIPLERKIGYSLGGMANDFTTNATRNLWWLINAPQAIVDVASEAGVAHANPDLYMEEAIDLATARNQGFVEYAPQDIDNAKVAIRERELELLDEPLPDLTGEGSEFGGYGSKGEAQDKASRRERAIKSIYKEDDARNYRRAAPGVRVRKNRQTGGYQVHRGKYSPTLVNVASMLPAAVAVNTGIGLMGGEDNGSITGRQAGYQAALPSEDDPRQTSNAIAEVGMRYLLGREGNLMDMDDFLLERPHVTAGEYAKNKGYLRDRDTDLNPFDDGKINIVGVLKNNPDGIRGAEVNFLGKSMGINDTIIPTASAIAGSALGALAGYRNPRIRGNKAATIASLAGGGIAGLVGGQATGTALEDQRSRSNFAERNPGVDYDTYRSNARELMDRKYNLIKANPNAAAEREESKVGFNKRSQQQALQTKALQQQALVDQILDEERKARAQKGISTQEWALSKSAAIDEEIRRRRQGQEEEQPASLSL